MASATNGTPLELNISSDIPWLESPGIFYKQALNDTSFYATRVTEITAVLVLLVGVVGNSLGAITFLYYPMGRKTLAVDKIVGMICVTGLVTTLVSAPLHLVVFYTHTLPINSTLCQLQGFLLNLLSLMSVWYSLVLASERLLRIVSPHEHRLTFSSLNLNVILSGIFVLLVVEVSGPIYGWAEYGFVSDSAICLLNPKAKHIFTYSVVHTSCYILFPIFVTSLAIAYVIREISRNNHKLSRGSQVLKEIRSVIPLCLAVIVSMSFAMPYYVTLLRQACDHDVTQQEKAIGYWLHIISMTCVYPCVLFMAAGNEAWPAFLYLVENFPSEHKKDEFGGNIHHIDEISPHPQKHNHLKVID